MSPGRRAHARGRPDRRRVVPAPARRRRPEPRPAREVPAPGLLRRARRPGRAQRRARALLTGQLVVAAYGDDGKVLAATGVQLPGVLDQLYGDRAADRDLGPTWRGGRPRLAVWAPTAKDVDLLLGDRSVAMRRSRDGTWSARGERAWRNATYAYRVRSTRRAWTRSSPTSSPTRTRSRSPRTPSAPCSSTSTTRRSRPPAGARCASPRSPSRPTRRSTSCMSATSRSRTRPSRPRTAAPTSRSPTPAAPA